MKLGHLLLKLKGECDCEHEIKNLAFRACDYAYAHVRNVAEHTFSPCGFSLAIILAESHVTVHTWPEDGIVTVDYFSCAEEPNFDPFVSVWTKHGYTILDMEIHAR